MDENDMFDGLVDEPDTELRFCEELTDEERIVVDSFRSLSEPRRAALWAVLHLLHRAEREGGSTS